MRGVDQCAQSAPMSLCHYACFQNVGGSCYFSWKVVLAEEAGALAVIIFDTVDPQSTAVLAIAGPFQNPRTPSGPVRLSDFRFCLSMFFPKLDATDLYHLVSFCILNCPDLLIVDTC